MHSAFTPSVLAWVSTDSSGHLQTETQKEVVQEGLAKRCPWQAGKPKTQNTNTSSPGSQKRMAHGERYLGQPFAKKNRRIAISIGATFWSSNWSCLPPLSRNYRSCRQPGRSRRHPGRQTTEVTSSAWHLGMF